MTAACKTYNGYQDAVESVLPDHENAYKACVFSRQVAA